MKVENKIVLIAVISIFVATSGWIIFDKLTQIPEDIAREIFIENRDKIESDITSSLEQNIKINFTIPEKLEFADGIWWLEIHSNSSCFFYVALYRDKNIKMYYSPSCKIQCRYFSCKPIQIEL